MTAKYPLRPTPEEFIAMSPEEIRNHIAVGMIPPELSDEQLKELPPTTLESYIYAREEAGDTGILGRVTAMLSAGAESQSLLEERRRELSAHDMQYRDGLPPSNSDYRGVDHQKLKADVEPISAEGITVYSDGYHKLHQLFQDLSDQLNTSVNKSKQGWEGGAADNAHGYFTSLATWSEGNSRNAQMASEIVYSESVAATNAKNSMPEPIPFNLEQEMDGWGWNPFTFHEQVEQTIAKQQESRAAHDEAARVMTQYDFELQEAGNKQPVFAEPPKFNGASGSGDTSASGVISINDPGTSASGFAGGMAGSPSGGSVSAPSGGGVGAGPSGGGSFTPVAPGLSTGAGPRPGTTRPSGLQPNGWRPPTPGGRNNSRNTFGPGGGPGVGPMPMGPTGGFGPGGGGGGGYGGRFSAGGFGPGGGGGAAGPGAGPGAGAATGAKPMGGPVAAGPGAAAPGAAGAARGAGMGGAPMGAGGGKGQGGEDSEHQRPTYLVEADPDEVFGTSQRTAPPVIGA